MAGSAWASWKEVRNHNKKVATIAAFRLIRTSEIECHAPADIEKNNGKIEAGSHTGTAIRPSGPRLVMAMEGAC
jgi:hypothetical protein